MPICLAIGEGAGVAAAQACTEKIPLRSVDAKRVQRSLIEKFGVHTPKKND